MNSERFRRLMSAIPSSYQKLKPFCANQKQMVTQFLGPHYGDKTESETRPINMTELAVIEYLNNLSSENPQVLCLTHVPELRPSAAEMQLALNETLKRMHFSAEHRMWVMNALFGVGIMLVGLETVEHRMIDEELLPMTNVFIEAIPLEDFVLDMTANKWTNRQVTFCGHRFRMPLEEIRENPEFNKEERQRVTTLLDIHDRLQTVSMGNQLPPDRFVDSGELWSIFVPEENEVLTFMSNDNYVGGQEPLKTVKWTGPVHGPYHWFGFMPVPNNVMPLPPAANWFDADDLLNKLYTQCGLQASRQKTVGLVASGQTKDGDMVMDLLDGQIGVVNNPGSFVEANFGGVNQNTLTFAMNVRQMTSTVMGNLDALSGLGSEAGTLGQEKIIKSSASQRLRNMQALLTTATSEIISDIAFYLHKQPNLDMDLTMDVPGTSIKLPLKWPMQTNEWGEEFDSREGRFDQYNITIVPYSMVALTPGERAQLLRDVWRNDILPILMSGAPPPEGFSEYLSYLATYYGVPELREIYRPSADAYNQQQPQRGRSMAPTQRNYVRHNVSEGMTPNAERQQQMMQLMGGGGVNQVPSGA